MNNAVFYDMNLAECTSALRQKDGEKTIALEEIKNAEVEFDPNSHLMHRFSHKNLVKLLSRYCSFCSSLLIKTYFDLGYLYIILIKSNVNPNLSFHSSSGFEK